MLIADRLRALREAKNLSQGDIENRTGLARVYISRVENGHTVPSIGTLEKLARALEVPLYQLFYEGNEPPKPLPKQTEEKLAFASRKEEHEFERFRQLLSRITPENRALLLAMASRMATGRGTLATPRTKRP